MLVKDKNGRTINVLTTAEVQELHNLLSTHPLITEVTEPISPPGVKNMHLLESAVARQTTGLGDYSKYDTSYSNCATLVYGIACNHAFHNGNKRAALLCMIKHLYRNGLILRSNTSNKEVYSFLTSIAAGTLRDYKEKHKSYKLLHKNVYGTEKGRRTGTEVDHELDIKFIEGWLKKNSVSKNEDDRPVRWRNLFSILERLKLTVVPDEKGKKLELLREEPRFWGLYKKVTKMSYPYNGETCPKHIIRDIRKDFGLTTNDGLDNPAFYDEKSFIDDEIVMFKQAIYNLSKS